MIETPIELLYRNVDCIGDMDVLCCTTKKTTLILDELMSNRSEKDASVFYLHDGSERIPRFGRSRTSIQCIDSVLKTQLFSTFSHWYCCVECLC
jgi:hypothetical protein